MIELSLLQKIAVWLLPILFAITVHEVAHGWVAYKLGDPTAKLLGRLTLNPLKHIDMLGTIIVPAALILVGGFVFGWAKPVPVTPQNLRHPKRDMAWVALAGPGANLLMAVLWLCIAWLGLQMVKYFHQAGIWLVLAGQAGIIINLMLMVINLLPLPGLDGSQVIVYFLPHRLAQIYARLEPYGLLIFLLLLVLPPYPPGLLLTLIAPVFKGLLSIFNLPLLN